jgi:hypothetical protein
MTDLPIKTEGKTISEVVEALYASPLNESTFDGYFSAPGCDEYLSATPSSHEADEVWPDGRVFVAPVVGGSEGHYVHVLCDGRTLILGKTFDGWDAAWQFARRLTDALGYGEVPS